MGQRMYTENAGLPCGTPSPAVVHRSAHVQRSGAIVMTLEKPLGGIRVTLERHRIQLRAARLSCARWVSREHNLLSMAYNAESNPRGAIGA